MINQEVIENAVDRVVGALAEVAGRGGGGRAWTLPVGATRVDVVAMTQAFGIRHIYELRDVLSDLLRRRPDFLSRFLASPGTIVDLNSGAGLNGLLLALLAKAEGRTAVVRFVDHAPAALEFAMQLAELIGVAASPHLVTKKFDDPAASDPDGNSTIATADLTPAMPLINGATLIFAGHGLNCWRFDQRAESQRRQENLELQNTRILQSIGRQLDSRSEVFLLQVDVGASSALRVDWLADKVTTFAARDRQSIDAIRVANRSGREGASNKYAGLVELAPTSAPVGAEADLRILFPTMGADILLTLGELDALLGDPQPPLPPCESDLLGESDLLDLFLMAAQS